MDISDMPPAETGAGFTATIASKGMAAGAATGVLGWLTSDAIVGLIGLAVAVLGFVFSTAFRYIDTRTKKRETERALAKIAADEARAQELHALNVALLQSKLRPPGRTGEGAP